MFDVDTLNTIFKEEQVYLEWEQKEKNRILKMHNLQRKREAWNKLFPKPDYSNLTEKELTQPY